MTRRQLTRAQLEANKREREERQPALARQVAERSAHKATNIHAVQKTVRKARRHEAEDAKTVEKPQVARRYQMASSLPAFETPEGMHYEWVRRDDRTRGDYANLRKHLRSGWEIVRASEISQRYLPTIQIAEFGDCIGNEDSVLLKLPLELKADRDAQHNETRDARTAAVNGKNVSVERLHKSIPVFTEENTQTVSKPRVTTQAGYRT